MSVPIEMFWLSGGAFMGGARSTVEWVRARRFQQGLPVVVVCNGVRVREYPDGTLETLTEAPASVE